ncbi:hypothetical protein FHP26_11160, partial [Pseudomonas orientalis]|nr:hypothetical protein [Pseudomonas orientalis]
MLAKDVNDNACFLNERGACKFFASKLAPTDFDAPTLTTMRSEPLLILILGAPLNHAGRTQA